MRKKTTTKNTKKMKQCYCIAKEKKVIIIKSVRGANNLVTVEKGAWS